MRGTRDRVDISTGELGLIPTYAGNTPPWQRSIVPTRAHPHVCGEHAIASTSNPVTAGSSPRMRGTLHSPEKHDKSHGLIPTYAGNTAYRLPGVAYFWAHPHVCGEHPRLGAFCPCEEGSSPRMRGTHLLTWGFIPTHQVLELVWSPKPVLTLHDFWAYRRREARLYLLALLHPFRGPSSSFGADGRIMSFTPSKSTGSHG